MFNNLLNSPKVIIAQPNCLPSVDSLGNSIVVLDIPFALPVSPSDYPLSHPVTQQYYQTNLEASTFQFIENVKDRLVLWIDHHEHIGWERFKEDERFLLQPANITPACALLIDSSLFTNPPFKHIDTIVCHDDLDGVISAARFLLQGKLPYPEALDDAVAADTRRGSLTPLGRMLALALKSQCNENIYAIILQWLVDGGEKKRFIIEKAASQFEGQYEFNGQLPLEYRDVGNCRIFDLRNHRKSFNLTYVLCQLQEKGRIGIVIHSHEYQDYITVAGRQDDLNLPVILDLPGGTPTRVMLDAGHLQEVVGRLVKRPYEASYPKQAMVEVVRRCNLQCPLCPVGNGFGKGLPDMNEETFQRIVDMFGPHLGSLTLHNYGEPLLHPQLSTFVLYAKESGVPFVDLSTNGNFLPDSLAQGLIKSGLDCIRFSVDTSDPTAYRQYRKNGSLKSVLYNLKKIADMKVFLRAEKPIIEAQALLMRQNEQYAAEFQNELIEYGADKIRWKTFNIFMSGKEMSELGKEYLPADMKYHRYACRNPEPATEQKDIGLCDWPWNRLVILADGTLVPCCHDYNGDFPLGNVYDGNDPRRIWDTALRREFMIRRILKPTSIPMCMRCSSAVRTMGLRKEVNL